MPKKNFATIDPRDCTREELACAIGYTEKTIGLWVKKGCPHELSKTDHRALSFDVSKVMKWREGQCKGQSSSSAGENTLQSEKAKLTKLQQQKLEIDIAETTGLLVDRHAIFKKFADAGLAVRNILLAVPAKYSAQLEMKPRVEVHDVLSTAMKEAIDAMHQAE